MPIPDSLRQQAYLLVEQADQFIADLAPTFAARRVSAMLAHAITELESELRQTSTKKAAPVVEATPVADDIPM